MGKLHVMHVVLNALRDGWGMAWRGLKSTYVSGVMIGECADNMEKSEV